MTAPDARQRDEMREALAKVVRRWWGPGAAHPRIVHELAEAAEAQARARAAEARWRALREAADVVQAFVGTPPLAVRCLRERETTARDLAADDRTDPA